MIVEARDNHVAKVRRKGRRADDLESFAVSVSVDVPHVADADAPVSIWVSAPRRSWDDRGHQRAVRHYDGRHYAPLECGADDPAATKAATSFVRRAKGTGKAPLPALALASSLDRLAKVKDIDKGYDGRLVYTDSDRQNHWLKRRNDTAVASTPDVVLVDPMDLEKVRRRLTDTLSALLVVDGVVHVETGHPVVMIDDSRGLALESFSIGKAPWRSDLRHHLVWPAERFDESLKEWASLAGETGRRSRQETLKDSYVAGKVREIRPEVLRPDLLSFDLDTWILRGAAEHVLKSVPSHDSSIHRRHSYLAGFPRDVLESYVRLRDGLAQDAGNDELAALLEAFGGAANPYGTLMDDAARAAGAAARHRLSHPAADEDLDLDALFPGPSA
jgi:hypothetical protein